MFILVAAKPGLVKKQSPDVRTGSADERDRFACACVAFKWETNLFSSEVQIYKTVHSVSLSPVPYKGFLYISSLSGG